VTWPSHVWIIALAACTLSYLVGAIPFGFLVARQLKGIDIRSVGSGNIGATNVGRLLGFRFFLLVFALDLLKGLIPPLGFPLALRSLGVPLSADLPVLIGLAAILGHNFPVYLGFKGGKGVATSLGVLLALDPLACVVAAVGFFAVFLLFRYVSLSSIAGAFAFGAGHFARTDHPWSRENLAMSLLSLAIGVLLVVRHHKNLRRIFEGTEPRVPLRWPKGSRSSAAKPGGRIAPAFLMVIAATAAATLGLGLWVAGRARAPIEAVAGPWYLREVHRELTGQQRSTRVVFLDHGRKLAVLCPRYNKVLFYEVTEKDRLEPIGEANLEGRPVAIAPWNGSLAVLERPAGDDKHLGPGWWQVFGFEGSPRGPRVPAGYYPDDLAVTPDGRLLLVLSSGRAEGDPKKPLPGLDVFEATPEEHPASAEQSDVPRPIGHVDLEPADDAERIVVSASGSRALITLHRSRQCAAIDLSLPAAPAPAGRIELAAAGPYLSVSPDGDWIVMPALEGTEAAVLNGPANCPAGYLVVTVPDDSALDLYRAWPRTMLGRFPIKGALNLGGSRPSGLAVCPERRLIAVTTKPGAVHLISFSRLEDDPPRTKGPVAAGSTSARH
jgi:glycerol-3-phosphate acyltransferase PlsY